MVRTVEKPKIKRHQRGTNPPPFFIWLRHRTKYGYDAFNRWVSHSVDADGAGAGLAENTEFVYDGNQIILAFDGDGSLTNRYLWGPQVDQLLADEQFAPTTPLPASAGTVVWSLGDHLGSVRDLAVYESATSTTTVVNHLVYDSYGNVTSESDSTVAHLFGFTARPFDPATSLQNNLNRWYDAPTGRWLSEDPIGFEGQDANLYRYVGNGPVDATDPNGLQERERERRAANDPLAHPAITPIRPDFTKPTTFGAGRTSLETGFEWDKFPDWTQGAPDHIKDTA